MGWPRLTWVRTNAGRHGSWPALVELDTEGFGSNLDALMDVYAAAMNVPAFQLPGRRAIMNAHVINPAFRAIAVTVPAGPAARTGPAVRTGLAVRTGPAAPVTLDGSGEDEAIAGFAYGFHGARGQWWHDLVRAALTVSSGRDVAAAWLDDSFEVAEVHVRPEYQKRGIGRRMLSRLTGGLAERTAVLSTMDAETPARHLYRSLGFTDLLTRYQFSGVTEIYAVMGAPLPLLTREPPPD
jgi:ribosomal protein S18 acetylase RimI-like enzyme